MKLHGYLKSSRETTQIRGHTGPPNSNWNISELVWKSCQGGQWHHTYNPQVHKPLSHAFAYHSLKSRTLNVEAWISNSRNRRNSVQASKSIQLSHSSSSCTIHPISHFNKTGFSHGFTVLNINKNDLVKLAFLNSEFSNSRSTLRHNYSKCGEHNHKDWGMRRKLI